MIKHALVYGMKVYQQLIRATGRGLAAVGTRSAKNFYLISESCINNDYAYI